MVVLFGKYVSIGPLYNPDASGDSFQVYVSDSVSAIAVYVGVRCNGVVRGSWSSISHKLGSDHVGVWELLSS